MSNNKMIQKESGYFFQIQHKLLTMKTIDKLDIGNIMQNFLS